jgi:hypothetical protein
MSSCNDLVCRLQTPAFPQKGRIAPRYDLLHKAAALAATKEGQAHITEFDVSLSPGGADELRVLYDRIAAFKPERERPKPPRAKPSFGNSRWLGVPAETLLQLLDDLAAGDGT